MKPTVRLISEYDKKDEDGNIVITLTATYRFTREEAFQYAELNKTKITIPLDAKEVDVKDAYDIMTKTKDIEEAKKISEKIILEFEKRLRSKFGLNTALVDESTGKIFGSESNVEM